MPNWNDVQQFVRLGLQWASGWLVTSGYIAASDTEMFVGGALGVASFVWWWVWNRNVVKPNVG